MSFHSEQVIFLPSKFLLLFIIGFHSVHNSVALKCYVCGNTEDNTCDNFDYRNESFVKECPPGSNSCGRVKDGNTYTRSCTRYSFNDCRIANQVEYCYCSKSLCNGVGRILETDDEDLLGETTEGSGFAKPTSTTEPNIPVVIKSNQASIKYINYLVYIFLILIWC